MSFLNKMSNKMQETAAATKLLATLKSGKQISGQVVEAYIKKDFSKMIFLIESILDEETDGKKAEAYNTLSSFCLTASNYDLATDCINKALKYNASGKYYESLGEIYFLAEKYKEALETYNKCLELHHETENIYIKLIDLYRMSKNYASLADSIWKYIQKYNKTEWVWDIGGPIFNQESWSHHLNLKSPGTALCYVLKEAMKREPADIVLELSENLSSQPFPLMATPLENAAYHWIRATNHDKAKERIKCAEEWFKISKLPNLPSELKQLADAEWRANELAGHFDPDVLNKIYTKEQTSLQGKFMKATILICDIRGFSRLSFEFRHAPQVILEFLQPYFDKSQDIISEYDGILDSYLGDGFISFFIPQEENEKGYHNGVLNAIKASIELQKYFTANMPQWADIWKKNLDETTFHQVLVDKVGLGIGIHTGFVFVGEVGTKKRKQYTALGNVVNFTARLQGKADREHLVFSAPVYEYIKDSNLGYKISEMPEEDYSDLKNIPGSYKLYYIDCETK